MLNGIEFSKKQLKNACENLNIKYIHIPDLGIESSKRKELNSQMDYDNLFATYKLTTLQSTDNQQLEIIKLIDTFKRVALTCFEANIHQCHRKHLAESIQNHKQFSYIVKHL